MAQQVKLPGTLLCVQLPAKVPGKAADDAGVLGSLSPMWEMYGVSGFWTWPNPVMVFQAFGT